MDIVNSKRLVSNLVQHYNRRLDTTCFGTQIELSQNQQCALIAVTLLRDIEQCGKPISLNELEIYFLRYMILGLVSVVLKSESQSGPNASLSGPKFQASSSPCKLNKSPSWFKLGGYLSQTRLKEFPADNYPELNESPFYYWDRAFIEAGESVRDQFPHLYRTLHVFIEAYNDGTLTSDQPVDSKLNDQQTLSTVLATSLDTVTVNQINTLLVYNQTKFSSVLTANDINRDTEKYHEIIPVMLPSYAADWPAVKKWNSVEYWVNVTAGCNRQVPVEVGKQYTDDEWSISIEPISKVVSAMLCRDNELLFNETAKSSIYLAQYDLLTHIPLLEKDILQPKHAPWAIKTEPIDLSTRQGPLQKDGYNKPYPGSDCIKSTGQKKPATSLQALEQTRMLRGLPNYRTYLNRLNIPISTPRPNIWMGPAFTVSPLHTDRHHNIYIQIVGYKYFRFYPPIAISSTSDCNCGPGLCRCENKQHTRKMYPVIKNNGDTSLANTSQVDLSWVIRPYISTGSPALEPLVNRCIVLEKQQKLKFPNFDWDSGFYDVVLSPGDALFIPYGWWHFVMSLTSSIGLNYWF